MGARKFISLGHGRAAEVSYDELKRLLRREEDADERVVDRILRNNFPDEYASELKAANERQLRMITQQRWNNYLDVNPTDSNLTPYRISHEDIQKKIRRTHLKPVQTGRRNRVTDFSGWIYSVVHGHRSNDEWQSAGKLGEREVAKIKLKQSVPHTELHSDWKLIDADPLDGRPRSQVISLLRVGNEPVYGAPDYVFHNTNSASIIIVEVKVSNAPIPSDGWPNLRAQLWAYGWIDRYVELAPTIILIGEIWRKTYNFASGKEGFELGHTHRWLMSDETFCRQNEDLFQSYRHWVCGLNQCNRDAPAVP